MSVVERTRVSTGSGEPGPPGPEGKEGKEGAPPATVLTSLLTAGATEQVALSEGATRAVKWFSQLSFLEKLAILTHTVGNLKSWRVLPTTTATAENAFEVISKNETAGAHTALLYYQAEPAGEGGVALNLVSDNKNNSTVFVTSQNSTHASIKLTHTNASGSEAGDSAAAMLNLNAVKGSEGGTTVQGLRIGSEEATPNSKGPFATFVRGTGGSLKNIFRFLPTAVLEMAEVESEPGTAESLHPFLFFKEGKLWIKVLGVATTLINTAKTPLQITGSEISLKAEGITTGFIGSEAVTAAKLAEENIETAKVLKHGLKVDRLVEEELTNAYIKPKSLEGNRLAKETLGNEEIQTNAIDARTITAEAVALSEISNTLLGPEPNVFGLRKLGTGAKEALPGNTKISELPGELTEYAKLPGRAAARQIIEGTTKAAGTEAEGLTLSSGGIGGNVSTVEINQSGTVKIRQGGTELGNLFVKNIFGTAQLEATNLIAGGKLTITGITKLEGLLGLGARTETELVEDHSSFELGGEAFFYRLKASVPVRISSLRVIGVSSATLSETVVLVNAGTQPIILSRGTPVEEAGTATAKSFFVTNLPPSQERYKGEKVKGGFASSGSTIKTVISETEIELNKETTNVVEETRTLKFENPGAFAKFEFPNKKDLIIEPGRAVGLWLDFPANGWKELYANLLPAGKPALGTEGSSIAAVGVAGVTRTVNANVVGNNVTRSFTIRHGLGTLLPIITVKKEKGTGGSETTPGIVVTTLEDPGTVINENEVKIKFSEAGKPIAKEVYWVVIEG